MRTRPEHYAAAARHRADRLEHAAETIADRVAPSCRDVAPEQNRLRQAAGRADQRATVAEAALRRTRR
jgi:hypothetical protein